MFSINIASHHHVSNPAYNCLFGKFSQILMEILSVNYAYFSFFSGMTPTGLIIADKTGEFITVNGVIKRFLRIYINSL